MKKVALLAALAWAVAASMPADADEPREAHGVGDAYAAPGVALAWGILHGADEATTRVVVRIVADPRVYPFVAAIGSNPFSRREQALLAKMQTEGTVEIRVPRAQYADFPRTEIRFYAAAATDSAALIVFYLGVPDTTPEFATEANLDAYLVDRIARARAAGSADKR
jgi:hypothetical protein